MSLASLLSSFLGWWREAKPAPPAPPPAGNGIPVAVVGHAPPPVGASGALVVPELLEELGAASPAMWAPVLSEACRAAEITNRRRLAAFLANVLHETGGLRRLRESLDYSPARLAATWPRRFAVPGVKPPQPNARALELGRRTVGGQVMPARQPQIADAVYGGRLGNREPGDAWRFRGAGLLQLTGRDNWQRVAAARGISLEELEARILEPRGAAETAAWWWRWAGCNEIADTGDIEAVRRRVNGGTIGLADVDRLEDRAEEELAELASRPMPRLQLAAFAGRAMTPAPAPAPVPGLEAVEGIAAHAGSAIHLHLPEIPA